MLKKVMVVDDSELIHNMYKMMLKKYPGCNVISAKNGKEALDLLSLEFGIDLIILDINMPIMNGLQFLESVKNKGIYAHIPVIIASTEGKEDDTVKGLSLGAKGYIIKPFKATMLYNLIGYIFND
jgi:two-component system chemotaxis response regulator CheY